MDSRRRSAYDPVFPERDPRDPADDDLKRARLLFADASRPYLSSPLPWFSWAVVLPAAALLTQRAARGGFPRVLILWSIAILVGGAVEAYFLFRRRDARPRSTLGSWAMTLQGNLSLVAVALSSALVATGQPRLLPGLWLLLLGHSLFALGGLAYRPQRTAGILYQLGGVVSLLPGVPELRVFALATALGNLWIGLALARRPKPSGRAARAPST